MNSRKKLFLVLLLPFLVLVVLLCGCPSGGNTKKLKIIVYSGGIVVKEYNIKETLYWSTHTYGFITDDNHEVRVSCDYIIEEIK
jgi:hypothetical protein